MQAEFTSSAQQEWTAIHLSWLLARDSLGLLFLPFFSLFAFTYWVLFTPPLLQPVQYPPSPGFGWTNTYHVHLTSAVFSCASMSPFSCFPGFPRLSRSAFSSRNWRFYDGS